MQPSLIQPLSDEYIKEESERQLNRPVKIQKIHISLVRAGDTVFHDGKVKTVCPNNLTYDTFMEHGLFGDSYILGRKPVQRVIMNVVES